jgi:hypothetical protein
MIDSTSNSSELNHTHSADLQDGRISRGWVKPALERLSLKQALTGCPTAAECSTVGS